MHSCMKNVCLLKQSALDMFISIFSLGFYSFIKLHPYTVSVNSTCGGVVFSIL